MVSRSLQELFLAHEGKLSDKWEHYLAIYDAELQGFIDRGEPVRLLEIGVQNGGSLEIWAGYLPAGSTITGIDIEPSVASLVFSDTIEIHILDAGDEESLRAALGARTFDIIIDDGSHRSSDIIASFRALFGRLSAGGAYIVEDLHASYWTSHEGGFRLGTSSLEYLKGLVDGLNADHFRDDIEAATLEELGAVNRAVSRIAFYDSVAVIRKLPAPKAAAYRRVFSGTATDVANPLVYMPAAQLHDAIISAGSHRQLEQSIIDNAEAYRLRVVALEAERDALQHELQRAMQAAPPPAEPPEPEPVVLPEPPPEPPPARPRSPLRQALKRASHVVEKAIRTLRSA